MVPGSVSDYREHYFFHTLCVCVLVLLRWLRLSRSTLWLQSGVQQQQQRRQTQRELGGESSRAVEERKGKEKNTSRESVHINTYTHTQTETQTQIIEAAKLLLRCADAIQSESDSPSLHLVSFHFTSPPPPPQRPRSLFLACSLFIFKTSPKGRPLADDVSRRQRRQQHYRIFFGASKATPNSSPSSSPSSFVFSLTTTSLIRHPREGGRKRIHGGQISAARRSTQLCTLVVVTKIYSRWQ